MKRIIILLILCVSVASSVAQRWSANNTPFFKISDVENSAYADKSGGFAWIDYFAEDALKFGTNYRSILVPINQNYANSNQDSMIVNAFIGFDSIPFNDYQRVRNYAQVQLDSIFLEIGHQNVSGNADTIIISVFSADTNGFPLLNKYWSDTLITDTSLSSGNHWRNTFTLSIACNQTITDYSNFAIKVEYFGHLNDTFGIVAAYPFDGVCGSTGNERAVFSSFYPNSFAYWNQWHLILPTAVGGDIFYDCNNDSVYSDSLDGQNYIQNWKIAAKISSPHISVNNYTKGATLSVFPNPANDWIQIRGVENTGAVEIIALDGKLIHKTNVEEGNKNVFVGNLPSGIYIIKLQQIDKIHYAKIVVAH